MKILLITPLYPPDVSEPAPYTKELAKRLSSAHEVEIVTYGKIPEQIEGVAIHAIDKQMKALKRVRSFRKKIEEIGRNFDILLVVNGPSAELPATLASKRIRKPVILLLADKKAYEHRNDSVRNKFSYMQATNNAKQIIDQFPNMKPEILPFREEPSLSSWNESWDKHLENLENILDEYGT